jgi:Protein of unknown function (DUF1631)
MTPPAVAAANLNLARQAREQFVAHAAGVMAGMATAVAERMVELIDQSESARDAQKRRDFLMTYRQVNSEWTQGTMLAWRKALLQPAEIGRGQIDSDMLALIGDDVVENKILSSRLALGIMDKVGAPLNELRIKIQLLEVTKELPSQDILRPEVLALLLVEQWTHAGLERFAWILVQDVILKHLSQTLSESYSQANQFLVSKGVAGKVDLKSQIKRAADTGFQVSTLVPALMDDRSNMGSKSDLTHNGNRSNSNSTRDSTRSGRTRAGPSTQIDDDSGTPIGRAKMKAQGLLGQLKRVLGDNQMDYVLTQPQAPSAALVNAINRNSNLHELDRSMGGVITGSNGNLRLGVQADGSPMDAAGVARLADNLRERTSSIKKQASTTGEKATIEIVALMFQSILAEERIPAAVRVWFARLQMPVMRVALFEPEFFNTLHHPARKLIDHMGSCVLGFDARAINGSALESEIRRVVQVIEQYPDTGRRVFQLVYDEFQNFLAKFLTEKGSSQRVVTLAQQVEQKETLAIQYTIEMRNMLNSMPVRDEIREFLFKVWAEALAVAAIKNGAQHEETIMLKRSASDLVWAASAKPNRGERARVIQDLPHLLQRLRQGMALLGLTGVQQELHIKVIGDTLADAFMSKTESIPQDQIDAMAERLAHLEDYVIEDGTGDIPLDAASIEMLVGIDATSIVVVADGGSKPSQAMMSWAQELQQGTWYTLDHNGKSCQVQFVWRSERKQLHLFASMDGRSFLIQARRLAAYLQAGLLVPQEEEALTVRATRTALEKLDANPERLLS